MSVAAETHSIIFSDMKHGSEQRRLLHKKPAKTTKTARSVSQKTSFHANTSFLGERSSIDCIPGDTRNKKTLMLKKLFLAKCRDLQISYVEAQERRFLQLCEETVVDRKLVLRDAGLGVESAKVIAQMLRANDDFASLDLRKNGLANEGCRALAKGLRNNSSIVHLDLGTNEITADGAAHLFPALARAGTLYSLNLSSGENLNRNRIGPKGCAPLAGLLRGGLLGILNVADNGIGNEGLQLIIDALRDKENLVSLNLSNNEITATAMPQLVQFVSGSRLEELRIGHNRFGVKGIEELLQVFRNDSTRIATLDLGHTEMTSPAAAYLFQALKGYPSLLTLSVEGNQL